MTNKTAEHKDMAALCARIIDVRSQVKKASVLAGAAQDELAKIQRELHALTGAALHLLDRLEPEPELTAQVDMDNECYVHAMFGVLDAERGVFTWPFDVPADAHEKKINDAYQGGFNKRRVALGDAFEWKSVPAGWGEQP